MTREQQEKELGIAKQNRAVIWQKLKALFPKGKTPKGGEYQYFNFEYAGLKLRIDVYIEHDDIKKYGGNVAVSFGIAAFRGSGFIVPYKNKPRPHTNNDKERIYFCKKIKINPSNNFAETIKWIRVVVLAIASLYEAVKR